MNALDLLPAAAEQSELGHNMAGTPQACRAAARVVAAARKLYFSGRWTAGLPAPLEARMWEDLRDALGLKPGAATKARAHDPYAHRDGSRECRPVPEARPRLATSPFREAAEASAAAIHAPAPHGCPACDDAMECTCEPRLPFGGGR